MSGCDISFAPEKESNASVLENFLPLYRTIKLGPLKSNTSYWVNMVCRDKHGGWYSSDTITFQTGRMLLYPPVKYPRGWESKGIAQKQKPFFFGSGNQNKKFRFYSD